MNKPLLLLCSTLLLAACGKKEAPPPPDLGCADAAVTYSLHNSLQQFVKEQARSFAAQDRRQFVDADKVIAAAAEIQVSLALPQQDNSGSSPVCRAVLNVNIPDSVLQTAQANAPLIYGTTAYDSIIGQRLQGSNIRRQGGLFAQDFQYTPSKNGSGTLTLSHTDNSLPLTANALSAALLPYGVKSLLVINGKAVSREDALKMGQKGYFEDTAPETAASEVRPAAEQNASAPATPPPAPPAAPQAASAPAAAPEDAGIDLEQARAANRAADSEINTVWKRMDKTVQEQILTEQRAWLQKKADSCRKAAAQAADAAQAEYRKLQCDTRMTRERSEYLKDFAIP